MDSIKYKYDIAFSFVKDDEYLAHQINNLLSGRVTTFIYSKRQNELAGKDGEKVFNEVFGSQARLVVVFYRKEWGKTSWTLIEETAIRNRAYEKGYDFTIFIPLDKPPTTPKWLPKSRIWIGLDRWGIEGAASVIEARLRDVGGDPREETAKERAERLSLEIKAKKKRQDFLESTKGFQTALIEVDSLFSQIESISKDCIDKTSGIIFGFKEKPREHCDLISHSYKIRVIWLLSYANSLRHSELSVTLFKSKTEFHLYSEELLKLNSFVFSFDLNKSDEKGWRESKANGQFYFTNQLAQFCVKLLLDKIQEIFLNGQQ